MLATATIPSFFNDIFVKVRKMALDLLASHDLPDWSFAFNRRKQAMGLCVYHRRTIELSVYFGKRSHDEILDTILHEIAHALVGPGHGHGAVWERKCIEIGAKPIRCAANADMPKGRWLSHCNGCGNQFHRHRKPKRVKGWFCKGCGPDLGKLIWREQAAGRVSV
jgi:predicted SprT family Zn-dependent metalloprotease